MQQQNRYDVDLHELDPYVIPTLQTKDQRSSADHRAKTPRSSRVPADHVVPHPASTLCAIASSQPSRRPHLPTPMHRYTPSPQSTVQKPLAFSGPPSNRTPTSEFQATLPVIQASTSAALTRLDLLEATIYTYAGCQAASDTFIN